MPGLGGGFDQSYNAQAVLTAESLFVVAAALTQAPNDKEQVLPMFGKLEELPAELERAERLRADSGYLSEKNVEACAAAGSEPLIALKREPHNQSWLRFAAAPEPPSDSATAMQRIGSRPLSDESFTGCANKHTIRASGSSNP